MCSAALTRVIIIPSSSLDSIDETNHFDHFVSFFHLFFVSMTKSLQCGIERAFEAFFFDTGRVRQRCTVIHAPVWSWEDAAASSELDKAMVKLVRKPHCSKLFGKVCVQLRYRRDEFFFVFQT